jgi:hypothetical protein
MTKIAALILLDPPVGTQFYVGNNEDQVHMLENKLYRGGFVDFAPFDFDNATDGPKRASALEDLCYYYKKPALIREVDFSSPEAATVFLKRYVASHWMVLLQYNLDLLHKYENTYHRAPRIELLSSSAIGNCWAGVQYLNDRVAGWCEQVDFSITQLRASGTLGNFHKQQKNDPEKEDDFVQISQQLRELKKRVETVIASMTGLLSIVEAMRIKNLTNLGMIFIPLAFTCGIFSMSGDYAPGGSSFWLYWVIAVPLVILVFVVAYVLSSRLALVNALLPKKSRDSARVPKKQIKTADKIV